MNYTIDVDVDLEEFSDKEIMDYVINNIDRFNQYECNRLRKELRIVEVPDNFRIETTTDQLKYDLLGKIYNGLSLEDLENIIKLNKL